MSDAPKDGQQDSTEPEVKSTDETVSDSSEEETTTAETSESEQESGKEEESESSESKDEVPDEYDLKLSDDSLLNEDALSKLSETAKELGLTNEQAQKLVDSQNDAVRNYQQQAEENWKQQIDSWSEAVKNDKEMGGEKFDETVSLAQSAIEKFAPAEFKDALNESGYGNHPELVRTFARIGKWIGEDTPAAAQSDGGGSRRVADKFYGKND